MVNKITLLYIFLISIGLFFAYTYYKGSKQRTLIQAISSQLEENQWKQIDFSKIQDVTFDRVCFLEAYSSNEIAWSTLGFEWDVEGKTSINDNDGLTAIVFIQDNTVTGYCEYPLPLDDFFIPISMCIKKESPILRAKKSNNYPHVWDKNKG